MSGRFYRLTESNSVKWCAQYPQLARYYDHREYDWEDDEVGDEIYLIPEDQQLILHIALSEYHTTDYSEDRPREGYWHCVKCARYALPESHRVGDHCVDCVQRLRDRAAQLKSTADQLELMRKNKRV